MSQRLLAGALASTLLIALSSPASATGWLSADLTSCDATGDEYNDGDKLEIDVVILIGNAHLTTNFLATTRVCWFADGAFLFERVFTRVVEADSEDTNWNFITSYTVPTGGADEYEVWIDVWSEEVDPPILLDEKQGANAVIFNRAHQSGP